MGASIAVVDDEANIRETVAFALRREGYEVLVYPDGIEAWDAFREQLPDLVILDILMPRMDGLELCRKVRSVNDAVPIIFLTSRDDEHLSSSDQGIALYRNLLRSQLAAVESGDPVMNVRDAGTEHEVIQLPQEKKAALPKLKFCEDFKNAQTPLR